MRTVHYPAVRAAGAHTGIYTTGVDFIGLHPWIAGTAREADATELARATAPVELPAPAGRSTLLLSPVGGGGYIAGVLPFESVVSAMRERLPGTRFALHDGFHGSVDETRWGSQPVEVGGRTWTLHVERPGADAARTIAIALFALLVTLIAGLASRLGSQREQLAEAARAAAEERSRRLAETSTDMLAVIDGRGRVAYLSPGLPGAAWASIRPRWSAGAPRELVHAGDLAQIDAANADIAGGAERLTVTVRLNRADGAWVWVEIRMRVLRDDAGRVREAHGSVRDISERKDAERAIADAQERFRGAVRGGADRDGADGTSTGGFMQVNRALC